MVAEVCHPEEEEHHRAGPRSDSVGHRRPCNAVRRSGSVQRVGWHACACTTGLIAELSMEKAARKTRHAVQSARPARALPPWPYEREQTTWSLHCVVYNILTALTERCHGRTAQGRPRGIIALRAETGAS